METTRLHAPRGTLHVHLMVMHDGIFYWDHLATHLQMHEASFIVVKDGEGALWVWKDRLGSNGYVVDASWAGTRAGQHLRLVDMLQKGDPLLPDLEREMCRSVSL